eukprot:CAMPEP_0185035842 /NCGR_PEP_ID=MMETSP1103-20130426/27902_1 /TAXON_ID=36769 /ORGANISM="Paraphysomonas bandaiensis, Strain Caron Lab Isolate" /LENGTH=105 /DNA_ID=CAMNT_0027573111 /DNA_START=24 /DNA_END=338 /DNA_ORIENTATION=-
MPVTRLPHIWLIVCLIVTVLHSIDARRSSKEWNQLKLDESDGYDDDEPPLLTQIAALEAKRMKKGIKDTDTGPMILFVTLKHRKNEILERKKLEAIAKIWLSKLM